MEATFAQPTGQGVELQATPTAAAVAQAAPQPPERGLLMMSVWTIARDRARSLTKNGTVSEDIASEVMDMVFDRLDEDPWFLSNIVARTKWVRTVVANIVRNRWHASKRQARLEPAIAEELQTGRVTWEEWEDAFEDRSTQEVIEQAIDNLPEETKEVWYLRQKEGMKPREIAVELGISQTQVYRLIDRQSGASGRRCGGRNVKHRNGRPSDETACRKDRGSFARE